MIQLIEVPSEEMALELTIRARANGLSTFMDWARLSTSLGANRHCWSFCRLSCHLLIVTHGCKRVALDPVSRQGKMMSYLYVITHSQPNSDFISATNYCSSNDLFFNSQLNVAICQAWDAV